MVWVIVKTKNEQQRTFAQLKMDWCIVASPYFLSHIAILLKIIPSTNLDRRKRFKKFLSACKHQLLIYKRLFLHSFGDYLAILRENRKKWRFLSFSAIKKRLRLYQTLWFAFLESLRPKQQVKYSSCERWMLETEATTTFLPKFILKNLEFLSFLSNYELFSGLSDSENKNRATTYVCAIKNRLVHRIIIRLSLTRCNYHNNYSKQNVGTIEVFPKISQPLQTSTVDFQKAFFALIRWLLGNSERESRKMKSFFVFRN